MLLQGAPRLCCAWGIRLALLALFLVAMLGDVHATGAARHLSLAGLVAAP